MEIEPALSLVPAPQMVVIVLPLILNLKLDVVLDLDLEIKMVLVHTYHQLRKKMLIEAIYHHNRIIISFF